MKKIRNMLPYLIVSLIVIGIWKLNTMTGNYAWSPKGKQVLMLELSLIEIFIFKGLFWLIICNLITFSIIRLAKKDYKISLIVLIFTIVGYFSTIGFIKKRLAFSYYRIFVNQSVSEEYLTEPIKIGGYYVGDYLIDNIQNKSWTLRRYAISGLVTIKYYPAIPVLKTILNDSMDNEVVRADSYQALLELNTKESKLIAKDFKDNVKSLQDKKVIELGEYFMKNRTFANN